MKGKTRLAGVLIITGMIAGIFSVAPAVDSTKYLTEAAANSNQVIIGAIFQLIMALAYIGVAILLYPIIRQFGKSMAIGFLSFRIIATTLVIVGTIILLSILALSQEAIKHSISDHPDLEVLGSVLKTTRDYINHVFMILMLCAGNVLLYILLIHSKLIPRWISLFGIVGAILSVIASFLVLFRVVEIITTEYLILNLPTGLTDLILGIWLIAKGFKKQEMWKIK